MDFRSISKNYSGKYLLYAHILTNEKEYFEFKTVLSNKSNYKLLI